MTIPTHDSTAVLFLDLQAEIVPNSRTVPLERLRRSAGALAKLTALHALPRFVSVVPGAGAFLSEVTGPLGAPEERPRSQTTAFADEGLVAALKASGRGTLILSGVASEIVVQRTALDALTAGYAVGVAVDACGGVDPRTEDAAWRRIIAAGGFTTSVATLAAELAGDFASELGQQSVGLMYEAIG